MASYRDWMLIENPNELDEQQLKKAVQSMGSVANKRLRRMANRGINFGRYAREDELSGVRKFSTKDKDVQDLKNEFKRVRNFLNDPQSSLTGMKRVLKDFKEAIRTARKLDRKEKKDYIKMRKQKNTGGLIDKNVNQWEELRRWRDTWDLYNRLKEEGIYAPTQYDSKQVRNIVLTVVEESYDTRLSDEETWERLLEEFTQDYERSQKEEKEEENTNDTSTSQFFDTGSSD